jgi:plastocyanin
MRRLVLAVGAIGAIGVSAVLAAVVSSAAAQTSAAQASVSFSISGSVAGGVKAASPGDQVTFVFMEKNTGTVSVPEDLVLQSLSNATVENWSCVVRGSIFNPDTPNCEPGFLAPGQSSSLVLSVTVTGTPTVAAKVCLLNETSGAAGPCKTLSVAG